MAHDNGSNCLHCKLHAVVLGHFADSRIDLGEAVVRVSQVLGDIIASIPTHSVRCDLVDQVQNELPRYVEKAAAECAAEIAAEGVAIVH